MKGIFVGAVSNQTSRWFLIALIAFALSQPVAAQRMPPVLGASLDSCSTTDLTFRLFNHTTTTARMEIGALVGRWAVPTIQLDTVDMETGTLETYTYVPVEVPVAVGARLEPWVIVLPPGASLTLPLAFKDFLNVGVRGGNRLDPMRRRFTFTARLAIRQSADVVGTGRPLVAGTLTTPPLRDPCGIY